MTEQMFSTLDAANLLDVTVRGIENWRLIGELKPIKTEGRCRYPESELKRFLGVYELDQMYRTEDVAEILGVTPHWVEKWRAEGKLTPLKVGRLLRYPEGEIRRLAGMRSDGTGPNVINETGDATPELAYARTMI